MATKLSSARGLLALFKDEDPSIKAFALCKLSDVAEYFWHEIASSLSEIQSLAFNPSYGEREKAAYLASQIHYHLENYSEALQLALEAGDNFDITSSTDYARTLVSRCIDEYIEKRVHNYNTRSPEDHKEISPKMEYVVERMFEKCFSEGDFTSAIGIALETRREDKLKETITMSGKVRELTVYTYGIVKDIVFPREFKKAVVTTLVDLHMAEAGLDYSSITEYQFFLNDPIGVSQILSRLIEQEPLYAYQLAFDLVENQKQAFLDEVTSHIEIADDKNHVKHILSGRATIDINLNFLALKNNSDKFAINKLKTTVEHKNSVTHGAVIFANALLNAGTSDDSFLREQLSWVAKATNWSKFSAAASLGVIHRGNIDKAMETLRPYLPNETGGGSNPYSEGGSLYALGLIHANYRHEPALNFVRTAVTVNNNETIQHGGCLGLGLIAMATCDMGLFELLKSVLYQDSANSGEAASYAMGLIMLGSANEVAIQEMIAYAHETQHEKIIRALGLGLALVMYGRQEEADGLITQLLSDKDAILRYGGIYTMATAYVGTANGKIVKRLLHIAVSDVDYDVRKAAVTSIGFLLYKMPEMVPKTVALLAESYNPYVRQGAAMAIGIACAGKVIPEALSILEPLLLDNTNFVRQAAFLALSMVMMQANKQMAPKVDSLRESIEKVINEKHHDVLTKMGAIVSLGVLEAGGRNAVISLESRTGNNRAAATVGLLLGIHFWYWFPLLHIFSLSFTPACIIGVNSELKMPKGFEILSKAKPSAFAYPPKQEPPSNEKSNRLSATVLSTTNKAKARAGQLKRPLSSISSVSIEVEEGKKEEEEKKEPPPKEEPEPEQEILKNPARVLYPQQAVIEFIEGNRYIPVVPRKTGILLLRDTTPDVEEELIGNVRAQAQ